MLSMALNELATNAGKYGALSNGAGQVSIDWTLVEAGEERNVKLRWQEQGGPPVSPPEHKGFGSRLIENSFELAQIVLVHQDLIQTCPTVSGRWDWTMLTGQCPVLWLAPGHV
jgi:two-component sensor histidine kinase